MTNRLLMLVFASLVVGTAACQTASTTLKSTVDKARTKAVKETMKVDVAKSKIEWIGSKPSGKHMGDLKLKSGTIKIKNGTITGGTFVIDMNSINTTDLEGKYKKMLDNYLKNADFFNVEKFSESTFTIKKVSPSSKKGETHTIAGVLKLLGVEQELNFGAEVRLDASSLSAVTPEFGLDRTNWGILTKSSKSKKGGIDDIFKLKISLEASL